MNSSLIQRSEYKNGVYVSFMTPTGFSERGYIAGRREDGAYLIRGLPWAVAEDNIEGIIPLLTATSSIDKIVEELKEK